MTDLEMLRELRHHVEQDGWYFKTYGLRYEWNKEMLMSYGPAQCATPRCMVGWLFYMTAPRTVPGHTAVHAYVDRHAEGVLKLLWQARDDLYPLEAKPTPKSPAYCVECVARRASDDEVLPWIDRAIALAEEHDVTQDALEIEPEPVLVGA